MNLPLGTSKTKSNFFLEVAQAFEFLSLWYSLTSSEQEELQAHMNKLFAKVASRERPLGTAPHG